MKLSELYSDILESETEQTEQYNDFERAINLLDVRKAFLDGRDYEDSGYGLEEVRQLYSLVEDKVSEIDYSVSDLEAIARETEEPEELVTPEGVFLSAAFNESGIDQVRFPNLEGIDYVGLENSGEIIVEGETGDRLGREMEGGKIIVEGDAGSYVGNEMQTGEIVIEGNAEGVYGPKKANGRIEVKGDCLDFGQRLEAGELKLEGDAQFAGVNMNGGNIFIGGDVIQTPIGFSGLNRSDGTKGSRDEVKNGVGYNMQGGTIEVAGDVKAAGELMKAGEIWIEGSAEEVGYDMRGGEIYVKRDIGEIPETFEDGKIHQKQDGNWERVFP